MYFVHRYWSSRGLTLVELMISLSLLMVLSFSVYKGARIGSQELKLYFGMKQAQSLANNLCIDYELAGATQTIHDLSDFIGYRFTKAWPLHENSLFFNSATIALTVTETAENNLVLQKHCLVSDSVFQPCWSASLGLVVKYNGFEFRPSYTKQMQMADLAADVKSVQDFYFQQRVSFIDQGYSDETLAEDEADTTSNKKFVPNLGFGQFSAF